MSFSFTVVPVGRTWLLAASTGMVFRLLLKPIMLVTGDHTTGGARLVAEHKAKSSPHAGQVSVSPVPAGVAAKWGPLYQ